MQYLYNILFTIPGAVIAITAHEYVIALISTRLGDSIPKARGRLTINPLKHLDPLGFLVMLICGYGWGRPVETSSILYRNNREHIYTTYIPPSLVNIIIGIIFAMLLYIFKLFYRANLDVYSDSGTLYLYSITSQVICKIANCNLALAFFNIIPIPPLDGSKILDTFLSPLQAARMDNFKKPFQLLLLVFLITGLINRLFDPVIHAILSFVERI